MNVKSITEIKSNQRPLPGWLWIKQVWKRHSIWVTSFVLLSPRSWCGVHSSFWLLTCYKIEKVRTAVPGCCGGRTQCGKRTRAWSPCACHCAGHSSGAFHLSQRDIGFDPQPANARLNSELHNKARKVILENFSQRVWAKSLEFRRSFSSSQVISYFLLCRVCFPVIKQLLLVMGDKRLMNWWGQRFVCFWQCLCA